MPWSSSGVRPDGTKELVSITDGHRESTESWADVLRDLERRGMRAPVLAVGDGALGFWAALARRVPRDRRSQRAGSTRWPTCSTPCPSRRSLPPVRRWPRSATPRTVTHAGTPSRRSSKDYQAKWPKAAEKIIKDTERAPGLLRLPGRALGTPEDHQPDRVHLRHGAPTDQGHQGAGFPGRRPGHGLQADRGRPGPLALVNAPHLVALVRAGVKFDKGVMVERETEDRHGGRRVNPQELSSTGLDYFSRSS